MRKICLITISLLIIPKLVFATQIVYGTVYAPNGTVTSVNLNGNFSNVSSVVNGKLDNTNADTTSGYRFYQTVSVLPASGNQGAVYFLTSDNSLNFDNGSSFSKSISVINPVAGDLIYYDGAAWQRLAKGTAGQYLQMNAAATAPQWTSFTGMIVMWSGTIATIPTGWVLCNGSNGTPDLRNRFIVAADADSGGVAKSTITGSAAQTGGSTTITQGNLPSYNLTVNGRSAGGDGPNFGTSANGGASESLSISSGGSATAYTQPFYALAYIMKT